MAQSEEGEIWQNILNREELKSPAFWRALHERDLRDRYTRKAPPLRAQIFTRELKDLATQVRGHRAGDAAAREEDVQVKSSDTAVVAARPDAAFVHFEDVLTTLPDPFHIIMRLYAGRDTTIPSLLLDDLMASLGSRAAALLLFSREEAVFETVCSTGLDDETRCNLWVPVHDSFLDQEPVHMIVVTEQLKANPFFRKRFSPRFLDDLGSILVCRRPDLFYPALLLFFFGKGESPRADFAHSLLRERLDWLHPLLVRRMEALPTNHPRRNIYVRVARETRAFLALGRGAVLMQFHFDHMLEQEVGRRFMREIRQSLSHGRNCLALRIRHDSLKLLLADSEPDRGALVRSIETLAAGFGVGVRWDQQIVGPEFVSSMVL